MFCSKCGVEIKDGSKFCTSCGARIPEPNVQQPYQQINNTAKPGYTQGYGISDRQQDNQSQPGFQQPDLQQDNQPQPGFQQPYQQQGYQPQSFTNSHIQQPERKSATPSPAEGKKKLGWKFWVPVSVAAAVLIITGILLLVLKNPEDGDSKEILNRVYEEGDEVPVGDLICSVEKLYASNTIPERDRTYIVVDVSVRNEGEKAIEIDDSMFLLLDEKENQESAQELSDLLPEDLSAGEEKLYSLLFDAKEVGRDYSLKINTGEEDEFVLVELELKDNQVVELSEEPEEVAVEVTPEAQAVNWEGDWTRTGDTYYNGSNLVISDLGNGSFSFTFDAYNGGNSGYSDGIATAIGNNAVYENLDGNYNITFTMNGDVIEVVTGGDFFAQLGAGVTIDGSYETGVEKKQPPTLVELGVLDSDTQEQLFKELVQEDYDQFISSFQIVTEGEDVDGYGAKVYSGAVHGLYTMMEGIIMSTPQNEFWAAIIVDDMVNYYTNTADTMVVPLTIENWRSPFSGLEVAYKNYAESAPPEEEASEDYSAVVDYYFNPNYNVAVDDIAFSPREIYYEDGQLYAVMYIYNGKSTNVYDINGVEISIGNGVETIAEGKFGSLENAEIAPYSYITWTFRFLDNAVYVIDSDLSYIETNSYCNYSY